ncbi:hypothetical protein C8Q78DRAFT_1022757 [Trametes maxima]|nr:hypothetical protein C8Q78DRAFT_1022757 [Trametes maxima]
MASSSTHSNMIQFPCLPSVQDHWNTSRDQPLLPMRRPGARDSRTLKPSKSTESLTQRKDRVEFLRRREWTRRVSGGADQPPSASVSFPSSRTSCQPFPRPRVVC